MLIQSTYLINMFIKNNKIDTSILTATYSEQNNWIWVRFPIEPV